MDCDVFVSHRVTEAGQEAAAIKAALDEAGVRTYLCSAMEGRSLADEVIGHIRQCKLMLILGTRTYGRKTPSSFGTYEELRYVVDKSKDFFLVKRAPASRRATPTSTSLTASRTFRGCRRTGSAAARHRSSSRRSWSAWAR